MRTKSQGAAGGGNRVALSNLFMLVISEVALAAYAAISHRFRRWRIRQLLAALNAHQLRDIGLPHPDVWGGRLGKILAERGKADLTCRTLPAAGPGPPKQGAMRRTALAERGHGRIYDFSKSALHVQRKTRPTHRCH